MNDKSIKVKGAAQPMNSKLCLNPICGYPYSFTKYFLVRDKTIESCQDIDYKPCLVSREDKDDENLDQDKNFGKFGDTNEPNKYGDPNATKIPVLNTYGIISHIFLMPKQKYV